MARRWRPSATIKASFALHAGAGAALVVRPRSGRRRWPPLLANHGVLTAAGLWPRSSLLGPNITRLPPAAAARGEIALTIDDGPDPEVTPRVLDLLDEAGAKATFFCIGDQVVRHAGAGARDGRPRPHASRTTASTTSRCSRPWGRAHVAAKSRPRRRASPPSSAARRASSGPPPACAIPSSTPSSPASTCNSSPGRAAPSTPAAAMPTRSIERLTRGLAAGDILLLHDGNAARTPSGRPVILEVLPRLLATAREAGLRSVTLSSALSFFP